VDVALAVPVSFDEFSSHPQLPSHIRVKVCRGSCMRKLMPLLFVILFLALSSFAQTTAQPLVCIRLESTSPLIRPQLEDLADRAVRAVNGNEHITSVKIAGPTSDVHARAVERGCTHLLEMKLSMDRGSVSATFNQPKSNPLDPTQQDRNSRWDERRLDLSYVVTAVADSNAKIEGDTLRKVQVDAAGPGRTLQEKLHEVTENSARVAVRKMKKKWKL
jgi:hypothetical protein